jgi:isoleucyl-tRNA synthetase
MKKEQEQKQELQKSAVAQSEENILSFWQENKIFKKTLDKESPNGDFVFYDGPPFATGMPHYGHLLTGAMKDVIPRYKTMQGYHVPRKWGWDCHGLPIENLIEKELGLATKKDIEDYGIDKFNTAARNSVLRYEKEWKKAVPRSGRFIDMDNPYMAMDPEYMESIWWVFGELHKKGLTKEGFKAMHLCPRCETTLANFEVNQGYKDKQDKTVTVKFKVLNNENKYILAWTTTPWTLMANLGLAVGADITYVEIKDKDS